jgi:hypothetical protein
VHWRETLSRKGFGVGKELVAFRRMLKADRKNGLRCTTRREAWRVAASVRQISLCKSRELVQGRDSRRSFNFGPPWTWYQRELFEPPSVRSDMIGQTRTTLAVWQLISFREVAAASAQSGGGHSWLDRAQ